MNSLPPPSNAAAADGAARPGTGPLQQPAAQPGGGDQPSAKAAGGYGAGTGQPPAGQPTPTAAQNAEAGTGQPPATPGGVRRNVSWQCATPDASFQTAREHAADSSGDDAASMPKRTSKRIPQVPSRLTYDGTGKQRDSKTGPPFALIAKSKTDIVEPQSVKSALSGPDAAKWQRAMDEEYQSLIDNGTWQLVPLSSMPPGQKPIASKWVFKIKRDADGNPERYKARLVAKGFMQREGTDFNEVFAPVSKHATLRALLALAASEDMELEHLDVKTAFLYGELEETIYMAQPEGYETGSGDMICRLHKSLYGLRQAPRAWHARLKQVLESMGFTASVADPGLFECPSGGGHIWLLLWVDDLILTATKGVSTAHVKAQLQSTFDVRDLGEATWFLGMKIERDRSAHTIKLSQTTMANDVVSKFDMANATPKSTPLSTGLTLTKFEGDQLDSATKSTYAELVGSLMYLSTCTRPDLSQAVGALARYMSAPTSQHWQAAKGVLRYLKGTSALGITFGGTNKDLIGYCDSDFAGDKDSRRSTTGYVFTVNGGAISWSSKLQATVAASTTEAEYMAAASATKEALWLRKLMSTFSLYTH